MQLFFADDIQSDFYTLSEDESKHCIRVLRMGIGDELFLTDGSGTLCRCVIADANPKRCSVKIVDRTVDYERRPFRLHIAVAPTKNMARMEWFVEKAVEMGIDEITMLVCQRSERRSVNMERIEKIVLSAMKQSIKAYRPLLNAPTPFADFVTSPRNGLKLIAHCMETERVSLKSMVGAERDYTVLIGPEGDFSPEEVELAVKNGYRCVHLGPSRLRTETAGVAACHTINLLKQEE